jgi:hypothetical protein
MLKQRLWLQLQRDAPTLSPASLHERLEAVWAHGWLPHQIATAITPPAPPPSPLAARVQQQHNRRALKRRMQPRRAST